jgi:hypothetical protein
LGSDSPLRPHNNSRRNAVSNKMCGWRGMQASRH